MARLARNSARMPFRIAAGAIALVGLVGIVPIVWLAPEAWATYVSGVFMLVDMAILAVTGRLLFLPRLFPGLGASSADGDVK